MAKIKIEQVEPRFAQELETPLKATLRKLGYSIPESFRLRVSLLQADGRKKRSNAGADSWAPESERMEVWLEPSAPEKTVLTAEASQPTELVSLSNTTRPEGSQSTGAAHVQAPEAILLRALDRAESTPGWNFVSLKKFRDEILPGEPFAPGAFQPTEVHWQKMIQVAIEKRFILTGKVQNPKSPQFPVTTIRLNRLLPEVQEVLGNPKRDLEFRPIHIKGEPLSATILRERR